ncbi:uncharacterized protein KY384_002527 [Bacidia gigantensis]|uniref:uncharacterized protein n=1 Tax=Bacidia gigantensis TaxID=2732470 RepID=UPI001D03ADE9|nr:uncharacterized protein KY384_002527 [Bacidia gigantensis]KAG8532650.1 hypothetical protein KY384_002527 [Bacidia gigantensis]
MDEITRGQWQGLAAKAIMNPRSRAAKRNRVSANELRGLGITSNPSNSLLPRKMDGTIETRATRASKRRRISPPEPPQSLPKAVRSPSPDELASGPPTPRILSRNGSTPSLPQHPSAPVTEGEGEDIRRPSFSPVSDSSPDELDHTANPHTFYRHNEPYRRSFSERARQHDASAGMLLGSDGLLRVPASPQTPEYSRISTPVASPAPEAMREVVQEAVFVPYRCRRVLRGHGKGVAQVRFSKDGRVWEVSTGKCLQVLEGHLAGISALAWAPDSNTIASGSDDKSIWLWNVSTGKPYPKPLLGHHHYIYCLAFHPKGNILVSGSYDEAVILWDVRTRKALRTLPAHSDPVGGVDFCQDGTLITSCSGDGLIRIWDTATGQCLRTLVHEDNAPVTSVRFSPNGKFVLAWTLDACVRLWNYVEGRCVKTYQGHANEKFSIGGAFGTYGGEMVEGGRMERKAAVLSGSEDGRVVWWDVVSKEAIGEARGHDGVVLGVDTRGDGCVVTCGIDRTVRVWEKGLGGTDTRVDRMGFKEEDVGKHADANGVEANGKMLNGNIDHHVNGDMEVDK